MSEIASDATVADASATRFATSADGTRIAYESHGAGPALVLVDGALCDRRFGPAKGMTDALQQTFTVYSYDRRGRGESGDTPIDEHSREREIEDLRAVIAATGETPALLAFSSGSMLALETVAAGTAVRALVTYEAPYVGHRTDKHGRPLDYDADVSAMLARGDNAKVPEYFMVKMVGAPAWLPIMFFFMPKVKRNFARIGHTVLRDIRVSGFDLPKDRFGSIAVPVLALCGSKAAPAMDAAQRAIADAIPGAEHGVLEKQTHNVAPTAIAPRVVEFVGRH